MFKTIILYKLIILSLFTFYCQTPLDGAIEETFHKEIRVGAERTEAYFHMLKNKRIAVVANHTSMISHVHLIDSLLQSGFNVKKVFAPEHGFRGIADAGERISNFIDEKTGLPVISLYGNNYKPKNADLKDIDVVLFDIQDVGVRFYTYISTMHYVMEACAENNIEFIVLDRPNPNGYYIDGPILENRYKSFVGLHPVPVVHGMTIAEYALMINGEGWLKNSVQCGLSYVTVENYTHSDFYELPLRPSPNLPNMSSIYLYPSLCFFEGTVVSVGRGTDKPFEIFGHPSLTSGTYSFTPQSITGAKNPPHLGKKCYGFDLSNYIYYEAPPKKLLLQWLIDAYSELSEKEVFFNNFFNNLAGTSQLKAQIINGLTLDEIRDSWKDDLENFKIIRKNYLLYPDFE